MFSPNSHSHLHKKNPKSTFRSNPENIFSRKLVKNKLPQKSERRFDKSRRKKDEKSARRISLRQKRTSILSPKTRRRSARGQRTQKMLR